MGPRGLSGYLARSGLGHVSGRVADLAGGKMVVDALNCIYGLARKHGTDVPHHFDRLCNMLQHNDIKVLLLFDGAPDKAQRRIRAVRHHQRKSRERKLAALSGTRRAYHSTADRLRWQLASPEVGDVQRAICIANKYGFTVDSTKGEADSECVRLADTNGASVVSSDTDMLVHGAELVVHDICVEHGTYTAWRLQDMLDGLGVDLPRFQSACALVGGDGDAAIDSIDNVLYRCSRCTDCIIESYEKKTGAQLDWVRRKAAGYGAN